MKTFIQFVTTPTADTPGTAILLHFDDKRYIFGNLAEGTQRACVERGVKLSRVTDIFFTGKTSWSTHGGIMGMLLTLADALSNASASLLESVDAKIAELKTMRDTTTDPSVRAKAESGLQKRLQERSKLEVQAQQRATLSLRGGPNLTHTIATGRRFICRQGMPICIQEFDGESGIGNSQKVADKPALSDDHIKVWALPILPSNNSGNRTRKRSHDEFEEQVPSSDSSKSSDQRFKDQVTRQAVVSEMFNSDWRMDTLVEMPIAEVSLPATLFVRNPETQEIQPYTGPKPGDSEPLPDIMVLVRKPWPGALVESLPPTSPSECAMSYIIRNHDVRGKFDAKKAAALGVQRGPDYRKLTENQSVLSKNGQIITPDMVLGESRIGKGVAIIELPSVDYVENLIARPEWKSTEVMNGMTAFIWILGKGVGAHPRLQEFISTMSQAQHVFSSPDYSPNDLTFRAVARSTMEFSEIDSARYSPPKYVTSPRSNVPRPEICVAKPGMVVNLEPEFSIENSQTERNIDINQIKRSVGDTVRGHVDAVRQKFNEILFQTKVENMRQSIPNNDAEIITLGTGSSLPSMYRNVAGTLLRVPGHGSYLFDCGEGTLGQLKRVFSPEELKEVLRELKVIWISHLHADHHLGTVSVIKAWYEETFGSPPQKTANFETNLGQFLSEKRLCIVSDIHMLDWLAEYSHVENYGYDKIVPLAATSYERSSGYISSVLTLHRRDKNGLVQEQFGENRGEWINFDSPKHQFMAPFQAATGLSSIFTVPVSHCQGAKAVSFTFPSGLKVSYSGDCRPSEAFTRIGRDSTVLLHEATFEDDMFKDALAKRHSTLSEALMVGKEMHAKVIVLTHFSQRYREMPNIEKAKKTGFVPKFRHRKSPGFVMPNAVRDIPATEETQQGLETSDIADDLSAKEDLSLQKALGDDVPVILAFDYMRLRLGDALHAEAHMPAMKEHLSASEVEF
ncbi:hypothetical protein D8B26_005531 [Coccidioides posadasii str. Silveira]|uniref:ribonuclease Z n=1 Tax=Coccidioides posadasii (strain C735) TaxID=222929 RepID=C5P8D7_COCP7|nr:metallo-beta-lactamase superfamily protein [Coccidioides posadasii C735 delta SOWgp]EER26908.1 metallo-beta-lactamase superfamily protein [Coccidioides posadasii C735 delta SOWgp]QVM10879.1 hypothetical protein D8B26_005531 [Coccidioides posadasii str. Silveira]|eukprot:XP_003069053.1 metallo-beta-lactamase superfamily protein [Coccidioides posadasii C735 delta SOWgp]